MQFFLTCPTSYCHSPHCSLFFHLPSQFHLCWLYLPEVCLSFLFQPVTNYWVKCKNLGGLDFGEFNNVINWSRESFMYIIEPPRREQSSSASSCQRGCAVSVLGEFPDLTIVKSWATWSKFGVELVLHRMLGKALANQDPFPLELFCNYLRISWNPVRNSQWKSHFGPPKRDSSTDSPEGTVPGAV